MTTSTLEQNPQRQENMLPKEGKHKHKFFFFNFYSLYVCRCVTRQHHGRNCHAYFKPQPTMHCFQLCLGTCMHELRGHSVCMLCLCKYVPECGRNTTIITSVKMSDLSGFSLFSISVCLRACAHLSGQHCEDPV